MNKNENYLDNIEINNNVNIEDLCDNKKWIHGNSKKDILITIFLVTIGGNQLKYSLDSINNLSLEIPVLVNVIMNISPTNKAYNMMRIRCDTQYFIQYDEDMEIYPDGIITIVNTMKKKKIFLRCFRLIDNYLGISNPPTIYGMKLYNNNIMINYPTSNNGDDIVSSVDRLWHDPILKDGHAIEESPIIIGFHARKRYPFDLLLRYSKSTNTFLNSNVKKNSGDLCRLLRPINKLENFESIYNSIISHFILCKYDIQIYFQNFEILKNKLSRNIPCSSLELYGISQNYKIIPDKLNACDYNINNFINLYEINTKQLNDIYCIIGIINKLFNNYEYSFDKYPYDINNYFQKIFTVNIQIQHDIFELLKNNLNIIHSNIYHENNGNNGNIDDIKIKLEDNNIIVTGIIDNNQIIIPFDELNKSYENIIEFIINQKRHLKLDGLL